ncbi:MAG: YdeI/OmpD-associated family protein [Gemmatimonadales bacterium]
MTETHKDLPVIAFASDCEWEGWLRAHGDSSGGLWVKFAKKGNDASSLTKTEAIRTALCWGWIDGQLGSWDEAWFITRFTRRGPRSKWSQVNVKHVEELEAEGRMQQQGSAQVDQAKADGRWDAAYSSVASKQVPPELQALLDANPSAAAAFDSLDSANRYAMCYRIETAKRPDTKLRNAAKFVAMLERGERLH